MKNNMPATPINSRFGWPKPARTEEFKKLLAAATGATTRIVFQGKNADIPIIRVPIELPKYRMANGRTASLQSEYLAKNPSDRSDMFSGDAELWDAQETQHKLLLQLAKQSDLQQYFQEISNIQVDALILDESGFVVNGNRRLATWRELLWKFPEKYEHFRHIDVSVLSHCEEREIDRLEATLQIEKDIKADYSWDAQANMMLAKQKRDGFSNKELANLYGMKEGDLKELLDMRSYADEYLRLRNKANLWSQVSEHEYAFRKIVDLRPKISGIGNQDFFKQVAFTLIEKPEDAGGRLYEAIPALVDSLELVKEKLQDVFDVKPATTNKDLDGLFGGGSVQGESQSIDLLLVAEIQKSENSERARKIIVEVIESQKQLKKDAKSASYLLDCCARAQSCLAAAVKDGLRPESKLVGVAKQLDQIQIQTEKIRTYLAAHVEN